MYKCECGKEYSEKDFGKFSAWLKCPCGKQVRQRLQFMINFNSWKPDYRQMDGEKEFIAAGGYE